MSERKPAGRAAMRIEDNVERLSRCEELLRLCKPHGSIEETLSTEWKVTHRQVRDYIKAVYVKWARDAAELGLDKAEVRVSQRRSQLEAVLEMALTSVNDKTGQPDFRAAVRALELLCKVDGVIRADVNVVVNPATAVVPGLSGRTPDEARAELLKFVQSRKKGAN
jgi:hypothetical protein